MEFKNKQKYITRGVSLQVSEFLQRLMFRLVEDLNNSKKNIDYLQIFNFSIEKGVQKIIHHTEVPRYKKVHSIPNLHPDWQFKGKCYIIIEETYMTCMIASEY